MCCIGINKILIKSSYLQTKNVISFRIISQKYVMQQKLNYILKNDI